MLVVSAGGLTATGLRPVTISSFSAGAMSDGRPAAAPSKRVGDMYQGTVGRVGVQADRGLAVLSVFRLSAYTEKGGPELVTAVARLRKPGHPVSLTIAGADGPSQRLDADIRATASG